MVLDYIDPGYGDKMLDYDGKAFTGVLPVVENDTYNPFGGVAFTTNAYEIRLPVNMAQRTVSIKLSVYIEDSSIADDFYIGFMSNNSRLLAVTVSNAGWESLIAGTAVSPNPFANIPIKGFHNITLTLQIYSYTAGTTTHYVVDGSVCIDNIRHEYHNDTTSISTFQRLTLGKRFIFRKINGHYISNVLIATTTIPNQMQVVKLPIKSTDTDMTAGENGEYIATGVDQTLLQTIDTAQLAENYGTNTAISHIVVGGFPCYTSSAAANLTGISKKDDEITTHGSCVASNDSRGAVSDFWEVDGQTLADLANIQVGWKAGA